MGAPEVCGVDRAKALEEGCREPAEIHHSRDFVENRVLIGDVRRLENRPGEHQLPVERDALPLELAEIGQVRIIKKAEAPLLGDQFRDIVEVTIRSGFRAYESGLRQPETGDLRPKRLRLIENMVGPPAT